eukprot:2550665-Pyramimonas_sp.AAC.1
MQSSTLPRNGGSGAPTGAIMWIPGVLSNRSPWALLVPPSPCRTTRYQPKESRPGWRGATARSDAPTRRHCWASSSCWLRC